MAVIYKEFEDEIIKTIFDTFVNERNIVGAILTHKNTDDIIENFGSF